MSLSPQDLKAWDTFTGELNTQQDHGLNGNQDDFWMKAMWFSKHSIIVEYLQILTSASHLIQ